MGQAQSVSPKTFQEEYYLFFDERKTRAKQRKSSARDISEVRRHLQPIDKKLPVSEGTSEAKAEHTSKLDGHFDVSITNELLYATTTEGTPSSGDSYDDSVLFSDRIFRNDDSASDNECEFREYQSPSGRVISGHWNGEEFINGRITWKDGREYNGSLKGSVPDGFGAYRTSGGKEYTGYWRRGLQHGAGSYITEKDGCRIQRRGLWDNGQLVHWFDEEDEIAQDEVTTGRTIMDEIMNIPASPSVLSSNLASPVRSMPSSPCFLKSGMGGT